MKPEDMLVVYVAGPFRATKQPGSHQEQHENIERAARLALEVWKIPGCVAVCPHKNTEFFQGVLPDETWLQGDLALLDRSDALVLVEGWEDSSGTRIERLRALDKGKPVFEDLGELRRWVEDTLELQTRRRQIRIF